MVKDFISLPGPEMGYVKGIRVHFLSREAGKCLWR